LALIYLEIIVTKVFWIAVRWGIIAPARKHRGTRMRVIFLKDVPDVANAGEVKEVADGYGRNFLLPRSLAVLASSSELKKLEAQRQAEAQQRSRSEAQVEAVAEGLQGLSLTLKARAGAQGRLYGSVTAADIAEEIQKLTGQEVDKRKIELEEPIRQLGVYEVAIRLSGGVNPRIRVIVEEETAP